MNNEKTGKLISQIRKENGLTQIQLAEKIGVSRATVGRHICILKKSGILKRAGEDKNGHWIIVAR